MAFFILNKIGRRNDEPMQNGDERLDRPKNRGGRTGTKDRTSPFTSWRLPHFLAMAVLLFFCLNVAVLSVIGSYHIRLGWIQLTAQGLFKPLLMMNGCFLLSLMIFGAPLHGYRDDIPDLAEKSFHSNTTYPALLLALVISMLIAVYYGSSRLGG